MHRWARFLAITATLVLAGSALHGPSASAGSTSSGHPTPGPVPVQKPDSRYLRQRARWFLRQRAFPTGHIPINALQNARDQARALVAARPRAATASAATQWVEIGPRPIATFSSYVFPNTYGGGLAPSSGRVNAIAVDPLDPHTAYVGASGGGVWKTTDDGLSWTPIFDAQPSVSIGSIAIDPADPQIILVGTGDRFDYFGNGIFRSTDGGATWTKVGGPAFDGCSVASIAFEPGKPSVVLAGVRSSEALQHASVGDGSGSTCTTPTVTKGDGIYRSTDSGQTWTKQETVSVDSIVYSSFTRSWFAGFGGYGVARSTDDGLTWTAAANVSQLFTNPPNDNFDNPRLAVSPSDPSRLYVAIGKFDGFLHGLYTSGDGGATWSKVGGIADFCGDDPITYGQCFYDLAIAVDPSDPLKLYVGAVRMFAITVSGTTGTETPIGGNQPYAGFGPGDEVHADQQWFQFDSLGRMWVGNDGGVWRTPDGGTTFDNLNAGLGIATLYPGVSGSISGPLLSGAQDNGVSKTSGSIGWQEISGGDGGYTAVDPGNHQNLSWTQPDELNRSTDGGSSVFAHVGLTSGVGRSSYFIPPVVASPPNAARVLFGTQGLEIVDWSQGTFGTWWDESPIFTNGTDNCCVSAIAQSASSPAVVYVGTGFGGLEVSTNFPTTTLPGSPTWTDTSSNGLPVRFVSDVMVDPSNSAQAWVSMSGYGSGHVFHTTTTGGTWTDISGDLPDVPVNSIVVDPSSTSTIYAGTDIGVFRTTNGGTSWLPFGTSLSAAPVEGLLLDTSAQELVATTYGRGAFALDLSASPQTQPLTVQTAGFGGGRVISAPAGIDCPGTCSHAFAQNTPVSFAAFPDEGSSFANWAGAGCAGHGSCAVTATGSATITATFDADQPDALIGTSQTGLFAGNGVYNTTGSGQTKAIKVKRGKTGTLFERIQNDGAAPLTLRLHGTGSAKGFTVHYLFGKKDVTAAVKAGTYEVVALPPGGSLLLKLTVKVSTTAKLGAVGSFLLAATNTSHTSFVDAAKVNVTAG